jgi:cytoskeletal protein RodZ
MPKLLVWARESAGLPLAQAAKRTKLDMVTLRAWESEDAEDTPGIAQFRRLGDDWKAKHR